MSRMYRRERPDEMADLRGPERIPDTACGTDPVLRRAERSRELRADAPHVLGHGRVVLPLAGDAPHVFEDLAMRADRARAAILELLQHGKPVLRLITVTEGMPAIVVSEKLAANPYLTGATPTERPAFSAPS